jgi:hypothetical protein
MGSYKTFYTTAEVETSLEEWSDEELIEELQERGVMMETSGDPQESTRLLNEIWRLRRTGQEYDHLMGDLLYHSIGRVI